MIPIHLKPKRFPAALGNARAARLAHHVRFKCTLPTVEGGRLQPLSVLREFSTTVQRDVTRVPPQQAKAPFSTFNELKRADELDFIVDVERHLPKDNGVKFNEQVRIPTSVKLTQPIDLSASPKAVLNLHGARDAAWYTGKVPQHGLCPGVEADGRIYSLPHLTFQAELSQGPRSAEAARLRRALQDYFDNTWTLTEVLLGGLQGEEAFMRPPYHDLRHPMIFYYGHPAALYVNKLRVAGLLDAPINAYYEVIFETGVDEMSWDDLSKNQMAWPSVAEVQAYRRQVYEVVSALIAGLSDDMVLSITQSSPLWALVMAFEHERIHLETSSFLISELPQECVRFPEGLPAYHPSAKLGGKDGASDPAVEVVKTPLSGVHYPVNEMIAVPETAVTIGKPRDFPSFGWDNEYGQRTFTVPAFKASKYKITNGEFLEFMQDGGYARTELWTATGWEWRAFRNVKMPTHFIRTGPQGKHEYVLRLLFDTTSEVPWDWPVVVNLHEATAFAKWRSLKTGKPYRVMTELEHRAIRDSRESGSSGVAGDYVTQAGGYAMMYKVGYNTNLACASMSPVTALPPNSKGFHDVFGNAWEWTQDYFCALPGFQVHPYYEDFSTPCFDGLHHVIQGGSFISTGNECSVHSRFHFRPHFYQHASFRVVEMADPADQPLTSDTDAPGPYVGAYPFRRTLQSARELTERADADRLQRQRNSELLKHFAASPLLGGHKSVMAAFAERILQQARGAQAQLSLSSARILEVGCGPGGLTFALAAHCGDGASIIGVDHSAHSTDVARRLLKGDTLQATLVGEGDAVTTLPIAASSVGPNGAAQVQFRTADPMCLPAEMMGFDLVILHDVIDQLASPNALLGRLGGVRGLVRPGGLLVVSSGYQWSEERTPRNLWLGGSGTGPSGSGEPGQSQGQRGANALASRLVGDFSLLRTEPLQQVWHETASQLRGAVHTVSYFKRM